MSKDELRYICRLYIILESIRVCLIALGKDPARPSNRMVAISEKVLEHGLSIPLPYLFKDILSMISLALG